MTTIMVPWDGRESAVEAIERFGLMGALDVAVADRDGVAVGRVLCAVGVPAEIADEMISTIFPNLPPEVRSWR
jgi:hypothetical protein